MGEIEEKKLEIEKNKSKFVAGFPKSIFLIIATEFCERFSFCGLRTILSLYLRNILLFPENAATIIYHVFIMLCYFVPLIGAILADSFFGRFKTIFYFSIIYAIGSILMCLAAVPPISPYPISLTMLGLSLIAIGTGGIKPCVAAFGGDQFRLPQQERKLQQFFSVFYFTINFGGFVGMILTPILRKAVMCFGDDTCYALGFGFPALLMVVALGMNHISKVVWSCDLLCSFTLTVLFIIGKPFYRIKSPKSNIILLFVQCARYALLKKAEAPNRKVKHWLEFGDDKYDDKLIGDMKVVLAILCLYIPLPIFWSLFDQQGSRWTFQASRMNGEFFGRQILPDQMQVINPAIVLLLIPLFDKVLYPFLDKKEILSSPLQKMVVGGVAAGFAFIASGVLEMKLELSTVIISNEGATLLYHTADQEDLKQSLSGKPRLRVIYIKNSEPSKNSTVLVQNNYGFEYFSAIPAGHITSSPYLEIDPGRYKYAVQILGSTTTQNNLLLELGGVYTLLIEEEKEKIIFTKAFELISPSKIHMVWLVPQYTLMSIAEVMFAISGLQFSFTQAPKCMKTVTIAAWYLSVAVGNLIVIIVTQAHLFKSQADEFFLFAGLMLVDMVIFMIMSTKYQFVCLEADGSSSIFQDEGRPLLTPSEEKMLSYTYGDSSPPDKSLQKDN